MKLKADRFQQTLIYLVLLICIPESHWNRMTTCHAADRAQSKPEAKSGYVFIQPGTFTMGSPASELDRFSEESPHTVTLTRGFWMKETEVTQAEWQSVMGTNPSQFQGPQRPVEQVSWIECVEFCNKLSRKEGLTPCYNAMNWNRSANGYRLPTEAEWEYACRAGSSGRFCSGDLDSDLGEHGWYAINSENRTHDVKLKKPNAWGLYDMHGNVWEWCWDYWAYYPEGSVTDPQGPALGSYHVNRGGGWLDSARLCRSADRDSGIPAYYYENLGFRIVRNAD